jgi:hypothetical protein
MQGLFFCPLRFTALQMCNFIITGLAAVVEESQPQRMPRLRRSTMQRPAYRNSSRSDIVAAKNLLLFSEVAWFERYS